MEMSLAIVERQGQRPVAGCVGVLFLQLLDWNRRLATKKKKKKKRSLLPPLLKRCPKPSSPCPTNPHSPPPHPPPHLTISEEPEMQSTATTMQAPGLVARLMGLESMPVSKPTKYQKDSNTHLQPTRSTQPIKDLCPEARPLKMQKTSNRSGDLIINSGPTHLKRYNHNSASSSARSPRARLIQAATKILEPGLRPRLSLSPLNYSIRNLEENVMVGSMLGTKTNIGAFAEDEVEKIVIPGELPKADLPAKTNILEERRDTREGTLNYTDRGRKCAHVEPKVKNLVISGHKMEINCHVQRYSGEQRKAVKNTAPFPASKVVPKTKISGANLNKRVTDKPIRSGYLKLEKSVKHPLKSGTISNTINTVNRKRRTASGLSKRTEMAPFGNRFSTGVSPKREMVKKRENNKASSVSSSRVKTVSKKSALNGVDRQTTSLDKERPELKVYASTLVGSILEDLVSEITLETGLCPTSGNTPCIDVSQGGKDASLSTYLATLDGEQPSPISILEASFSTDSSLGSPVDEPDDKMLFSSMDIIPELPDFDSFDISTQTTRRNVPIIASRVGCTGDVFANVELLFCQNWIEEENLSVHNFLLDLLKNIMEVFSGSLNGEKEGCRVTNFLFDCIIECLDWKYGYLCKSGYKDWLVISQSLDTEQLFKEILKEMHRWSEMGGMALAVLDDSDFGKSIKIWSNCGFEGFEVGVEIESAIIHMLVETIIDEFVVDLC